MGLRWDPERSDMLAGWDVPEGWTPYEVKVCEKPACGKVVMWAWTLGGHLSSINPDGSHHWRTCGVPRRGKLAAEP